MTKQIQLLLALSLLPICVFSQTAFNPSILPLGDTESLMGNSGTGGIGSTGAIYYNPAALTMVEGNSLSLSGSAYLSFKFEAKPLANFYGTNLNYEASGFQTIPTSVIIVKKKNEWNLGFTVLVPMEFSYEGRTTWDVPIPNGPNLGIKFNQNYSESVLLIGLSAARKLGDTWSAGITVFGQNYSYRSILDFRGELSISPDYIFQASHRETFSPTSLLAVLGVQKTFEKANLGLRVALPSLHLFGTADYYDYSYTNFDPSDIQVSQIDESNESAQFATPLDVRLGSTFFPGGKWTLTLDLAYRFGLEYDVYDDPQIDEHISTKGNFRANAGVQYLFSEKLAFYTGGAYTPTTLDTGGDEIGQNFASFFAGGKSISKYFETSLGVFYSVGKGEGELTVGTGTTTEKYTYFGIVLGTNYRF